MGEHRRSKRIDRRIKNRWQCILHGHDIVIDSRGDSLEMSGHCKRCRHWFYSEPIPHTW